jgi:hypothetical protein
MAYTHIARNYVRAGGVGTDATIPHTVGVATEYCVFLTQDTTGGGAANAIPLAFAGDAGKGAVDTGDRHASVANPIRIDAVIVAPHSAIDVGPVVNSATRANVLATTTDGIYSFGTSGVAYRSLHRSVPITCVNGAPHGHVNVTHRLGTDNVVCFASPTSDPLANSTVGGATRVYKVFQTASAAGVVELTMSIDNAGNNAGGDATVTWDVMVLARAVVAAANVATWPYAMGVPQIPGGALSDDYVAGARGTGSGYAVLYTNVDLALGANNLSHVMNTATDVVALVGHSATDPGVCVPTISNNATSTTALTLTTITAGCNDCYVLVLRPYSMFQPTCTTA